MAMTNKHLGIVLFGLITSSLHLMAAFDKILFPGSPDPLFILNGLGFLGLVAAYFLPLRLFQARHGLVRAAFIGFVIVTILAWIVIWVGFSVLRDGLPFFDHDSLYGVPAKISEVCLLFLLWSDRE
jgi:hypothetical protein